MENRVFDLKNIHKRVLKNINIKVDKGDRIIVFGPSGAGKSTLLHLMNRIEDPELGQIFYKGKPISEYELPQLRKNVGLVLQHPNLFSETVKDNLKYGPSLFGNWNDNNAKELLDLVNLPSDYLNKAVEDLSGGEQQRVALARTLANEPEVLLLDEPTSALDEQNIESIEHDLMNLIHHKKLTVVMITHNLNQAKRLGTRGLYIENGMIKEEGTLPEMINQPKTDALKYFLSNH